MILDAAIENREVGENRILEYLEKEQFSGVIDIGGVQKPWASPYVSTYVDLIHPYEWAKRYPDMYDEYIWKAKMIIGNCEDPEVWDQIYKDIEKNSYRYGFAICAHLIEHLGNPGIFLDRLSSIAKEGFIATPNKYAELKRGVHFGDEGIERCGLKGHYRGFFPHRWICTIRDEKLWMFPKLNFIEQMEFSWENKVKDESRQLGFRWKGSIPYHIVDDTILDFPDPQPGIEYYREELGKGL